MHSHHPDHTTYQALDCLRILTADVVCVALQDSKELRVFTREKQVEHTLESKVKTQFFLICPTGCCQLTSCRELAEVSMHGGR